MCRQVNEGAAARVQLAYLTLPSPMAREQWSARKRVRPLQDGTTQRVRYEARIDARTAASKLSTAEWGKRESAKCPGTTVSAVRVSKPESAKQESEGSNRSFERCAVTGGYAGIRAAKARKSRTVSPKGCCEGGRGCPCQESNPGIDIIIKSPASPDGLRCPMLPTEVCVKRGSEVKRSPARGTVKADSVRHRRKTGRGISPGILAFFWCLSERGFSAVLKIFESVFPESPGGISGHLAHAMTVS